MPRSPCRPCRTSTGSDRGEVSIFGSVPSIARIERETVVTAASWRARACFLIWAPGPAWFERSFERSKDAIPAGLDSIGREVVALAREASLDPDRPCRSDSGPPPSRPRNTCSTSVTAYPTIRSETSRRSGSRSQAAAYAVIKASDVMVGKD